EVLEQFACNLNVMVPKPRFLRNLLALENEHIQIHKVRRGAVQARPLKEYVLLHLLIRGQTDHENNQTLQLQKEAFWLYLCHKIQACPKYLRTRMHKNPHFWLLLQPMLLFFLQAGAYVAS